KSLEMLKRDMEATFCSDQNSREQNGANAYLTRGLGRWIQNGAQDDLPVSANYRTPTGSINATATASLTENNIQDMLQSIYSQTGKVSTYSLVCGPTLKRQFTSFTRTQFASTNVASAIRVLNQKDENKIVSTVDIFEGDFGTLELIPSLFLAADATTNAAAVQNGRGYVLDMDMVELRYNRKPRFQELEDRGGGPRGIVDAICALCVKSPLALGKFAPTA
ncbi:MAG: SU10 major capsid protein, partial [Candidatus Limnocylindrus sp.]